MGSDAEVVVPYANRPLILKYGRILGSMLTTGEGR